MKRKRRPKEKEGKKKKNRPVYNNYYNRYENAENPHPFTHKETNLNHALNILVK